MKKATFLTLILFLMIPFFSFTKKGFDPLAITVKIAENTYMDQVEMTNLNWREYMAWTKKEFGENSEEYKASTPDQDVWYGEKYKPVKALYLNHAQYEKYPIVGITHEQAMAYCKWRADRINEVIRLQNKKATYTYSCRLPTKAEWEKLANSEMIANKVTRKDLNNLLFINDDGTIQENDITAPVKSYTPSLNGYYNLVGNVAEMVAEKGIAKGASWQHVSADFSIAKDYTYDGPTNWLGFRCVLVRH